jgi:hypothetical protein
MNTNLLPKTLSRAFPNDRVAKAAEIIFLLAVGMVAVALHSKLRFPMHLPGKQGLLFVTLILCARGLSGRPYAASISCLGSAGLLLMPGLGFHDPFMAVNYIVLGGAMDVVYSIVSKQTSRLWIIAGVTGLCWMLVPLFRLVMSLFVAMPMGAFRNGLLYPFFTYMVFGLAGGLAAAGLLRCINLTRPKN